MRERRDLRVLAAPPASRPAVPSPPDNRIVQTTDRTQGGHT